MLQLLLELKAELDMMDRAKTGPAESETHPGPDPEPPFQLILAEIQSLSLAGEMIRERDWKGRGSA